MSLETRILGVLLLLVFALFARALSNLSGRDIWTGLLTVAFLFTGAALVMVAMFVWGRLMAGLKRLRGYRRLKRRRDSRRRSHGEPVADRAEGGAPHQEGTR